MSFSVIERFCACVDWAWAGCEKERPAIAAAKHSVTASRRRARGMEAPWGKRIFISQAGKRMRADGGAGRMAGRRAKVPLSTIVKVAPLKTFLQDNWAPLD